MIPKTNRMAGLDYHAIKCLFLLVLVECRDMSPVQTFSRNTKLLSTFRDIIGNGTWCLYGGCVSLISNMFRICLSSKRKLISFNDFGTEFLHYYWWLWDCFKKWVMDNLIGKYSCVEDEDKNSITSIVALQLQLSRYQIEVPNKNILSVLTFVIFFKSGLSTLFHVLCLQ